MLTALSILPMFALAGCGGDDSTFTGSSSTGAGGSATGTGSDQGGVITVSAAASLGDAFAEIGDDFTATNPDFEVRFNLDSSSALSNQILEGVPVDVFASADAVNMAPLTEGNLIAAEPEVFARNELVIVTQPGNPGGIASLADLVDVGVISLCGEQAPCGRYAQEALDAAGVSVPESSVTRGQNAIATLTAVSQGDAVAAIVYVTDARSVGDAVETVAIPTATNVLATYLIGVVDESDNAGVADAFVAHVLSDEGRAVLAEHGFLPPP